MTGNLLHSYWPSTAAHRTSATCTGRLCLLLFHTYVPFMAAYETSATPMCCLRPLMRPLLHIRAVYNRLQNLHRTYRPFTAAYRTSTAPMRHLWPPTNPLRGITCCLWLFTEPPLHVWAIYNHLQNFEPVGAVEIL